jgi:4-amino-4-deoxy-L-arabinose transferase-like glycosyltransferase
MPKSRIVKDLRKIILTGTKPLACSVWTVAAVSLILLWTGLPSRGLWGPEGRWAVIVKEMIQSGNFFLPTINGVIYFDKPLLSYWVMVPLATLGGITETMLRIPSTLAAFGTIFIIYSIGHRLFSQKTGIIAALLLGTSAMFLSWGRSISAEMQNLVAIWAMLWVFLVFHSGRKQRYLPLLYALAAVSAFIKGPVAPAVSFFAISVFSAGEMIIGSTEEHPASRTKRIKHAFSWLLSWSGALSLAGGLILFLGMLLIPVVATNSWESVSLMWRENIVRFLSPFDHHDPSHAYVWAILTFLAPWTFLFLAALYATRFRQLSWQERWLLLSSGGILLFFLLSGSKRPYYILPLIPSLMLISARSVSGWLEGKLTLRQDRLMRWAVGLTALIFVALCIGLLYVYHWLKEYSHYSEPPAAFVILAISIVAFALLSKRRHMAAMTTLFILAFIVSLWGMTYGITIGERTRTTKNFSLQFAEIIKYVGPANVALFGDCPAEIIFYLDQLSPLRSVATVEDAEKFGVEHPGGFLLIEPASMPEQMNSFLKQLTPVLSERSAADRGTEGFVVVQFPGETGS